MIRFFIKFLKCKVFGKHFRTRAKSKKVYKKLQNMDNPQIFRYLRQIDPFVFEELLLYSFQRKGFKIYRNRRYTGDGGIDGKVKISGHIKLIQAKRYSGYINMEHVRDFIAVCNSKHKGGFFIHCGKTGSETKQIAKNGNTIEIISGNKLVSLIKENCQIIL